MVKGKRAEKPAKDKAPKGDKADGGAGVGHNKPPLTPQERQALHFQHVKAYEKALGVKKEADAKFKNACKLIKAEGGSVTAVKLTIELQSPEGEAAFRARLAEEQEIAAWNGLGVQIDLFADEREPAADRARGEGYRAGIKGEPAKPPHSPETEQYRAWMDGHGEGQGVLASQGFKQLTPVEQAATAGPAH